MIDPYLLTPGPFEGAHHHQIGVQPMLRHRHSRRDPVALRHIARILLRRADNIADREQKRRLDRQAFALVQEAMRSQLAGDSGQDRSGRRPN
jgi:hypothetical protein